MLFKPRLNIKITHKHFFSSCVLCNMKTLLVLVQMPNIDCSHDNDGRYWKNTFTKMERRHCVRKPCLPESWRGTAFCSSEASWSSPSSAAGTGTGRDRWPGS